MITTTILSFSVVFLCIYTPRYKRLINWEGNLLTKKNSDKAFLAFEIPFSRSLPGYRL
jgi:hypothetical protein